MSVFFSPSKQGFFSSEIHGNTIPSDCIEITEEKYKELLVGNANGMNISVSQSGELILVPVVIFVSSEQNKETAIQRLSSTDWVNQPDTYDPANTPYLTNRDAFLAYRLQIRAIAVNPVEGNLDWPIEPDAIWSS